jgi:hypothetical protein
MEMQLEPASWKLPGSYLHDLAMQGPQTKRSAKRPEQTLPPSITTLAAATGCIKQCSSKDMSS